MDRIKYTIPKAGEKLKLVELSERNAIYYKLGQKKKRADLKKPQERTGRNLEKLKNDHTPPRSASNATAHLFIENPFENKKVKNFFTSLFNTHPPLDERIKILRGM